MSLFNKRRAEMAYLLIRHEVADYNQWRPVYDWHESVRRKAGLKELFLFRGVDTPNDIVILFEAGDMAKAYDFIASDDLKKTMERAGVIGAPSFAMLERPILRKAA